MKKDVEVVLKISEEKWIKKLRDGEICFNRSGFFVDKALKDNNNEQGDRYEGIFARLHNNNPLFIEQKNNLGSDLEIIPDNDYVILRRHSCKDIPVFCMYGIVKDDLQVDEGTIEVVNGVYKGKAKYYLPHKMYKGFLDNSYGSSFTPWGYYSSAGHFLDELKCSLNKDKILYNSNLVSYDIDLSKEFFVEPTQDYSELFHKRKELNYQHEIRFILPNKPTRDKWIIHIDPLELNSADIAVGELYMEINVICEPLYNEGQTKA